MSAPSGARILVAVSAGKKSLVSAALLKQQGYEVELVHLATEQSVSDFPEEPLFHRCCRLPGEVEFLEAFARRLGVALHVEPAQDHFRGEVVDGLIHAPLMGESPSPCDTCHGVIKLPGSWQVAKRLGIEWLATGHHLRIQNDPITGRSIIREGVDPRMDQSAAFYSQSVALVSRWMTPTGALSFDMIQRLAGELGLDGLAGSEWNGCLKQRGAIHHLIERSTAEKLRPIGSTRTLDGYSLPEHKGLYRYEVGQADGLPPGLKENDPHVVVEFDLPHNVLVLGRPGALDSTSARLQNVYLQAELPREALVKSWPCYLRSGKEWVKGHVDFFENQTAWIQADSPIRSLSRGRSVTFYGLEASGGRPLLGGGRVDMVKRSFSIENLMNV